ncbi:MAG: hypothetical protein SWK90_05795 [Chloroflexota bacterium]|nr:hypothetical protein [Chloroflexota bacterium]
MNVQHSKRPLLWKVLLIGGHSGVGKTVVARQLARRFGVALAEVDDFRLVLGRMTTPEQQPPLHALLAAGSETDLSPTAVCDSLIAVAQTVSHALEIVVANHVATDTPTILEGDGLLPAFAARRVFANRHVGSSVRAVFLIEEDETRLFRSAVERGRGFESLAPTHQRRQVRVSWLYGQWLQQEAVRYSLPIVTPHPRETLTERIVNVIQ